MLGKEEEEGIGTEGAGAARGGEISAEHRGRVVPRPISLVTPGWMSIDWVAAGLHV